ncbi:UDP-3-O-(3-hydroxymyristoyl)glucosamine N-acyltransferase [Gammaproteobacteria bacterium]
MAMTLGELAALCDAELVGDARRPIHAVATLQNAREGMIAFLSNPKYRKQLPHTQASAVILGARDRTQCPVDALVVNDPHLAYAKVSRALHPPSAVCGGVHASAQVDPDAILHPSAWVGPMAVVEAGAVIGPRVFVGPGCIVGRGCVIGEDSRLVARVTLCWGTQVGRRVLLHPGCVIGSDGFGFAREGEAWLRIPHTGRVCLDDDVEVGANATIDRGVLEDTCIARGVIIDNLVQIGHNCHIGEHTAIVSMTGISGSTHIGRNCTLAGAVGVAGHLEIGDNVHFTGRSMVTKSFPEPGVYSGGLPCAPSQEWRKSIARIRQLDDWARRLKRLEEVVVGHPNTPDKPGNPV